MPAVLERPENLLKEDAARDARLNVRLEAEQKSLIERAAAYTGENVTAFTVSTLVERARRVVVEHETAVLSDRDRDLFVALLDTPPVPNARLLRAVARHAAVLGAGE